MTEARGGLSRDRIVRAAVDIIERDGAEAVSMRRLAAELNVGTMSLYNHVPNKAALLDGVADFVMADMELAADPEASWQDQARGLAHRLRAIARRYPRTVVVVITRQPRSGIGLHPVDIALGATRRAGFDGRVAVRLVRTFVSFVLGSLMHEAGADAGEAASYQAALADSLDRDRFTHVVALLPELTELDPDGDFEFGLELLITAMEAMPR
ncbi:MAG TPA: TetR/AcrR family transcriptional regulator [Pseudonocardia sp.]